MAHSLESLTLSHNHSDGIQAIKTKDNKNEFIFTFEGESVPFRFDGQKIATTINFSGDKNYVPGIVDRRVQSI